MRDNPHFSITVHGPIYCARTLEATTGLELQFATDTGPYITVFTRDADLSAKLAAAINSTIEAHAADLAQRTNLAEAAE
jgi:mevalonate pyrophosphate decarboxylase